MPHLTFHRFFFLFSFSLCFLTETQAQTAYNPDSTAFQWLSKGDNIAQFHASGISTVSIDNQYYLNHGASIRWDIPANHGTSKLIMKTGELDLRNHVLLTTCRRNLISNSISVYVNTVNGKRFKINTTTVNSTNGFCLPPDAWHQQGGYIARGAEGNATEADLEHVESISFECPNSLIPISLWIDNIRATPARGPVCIAHFNRFRSNADSLLVPWLLQRNMKANIDFSFDVAKDEIAEVKNGLSYSYRGLKRIDTLVHQHGWSCTSHGAFYQPAPLLNDSELVAFAQLDSFIAYGFDAQWLISIPTDQANPRIISYLHNLNRFKAIRKQDQDWATLPLDNPDQFRFFRPTSLSAGGNLSGTPLTIAEMKQYVDSAVADKGVLVIDFGNIVDVASAAYSGSEITMLQDAIDLLSYAADSLQVPMLTFEDILKPDPSYQQELHAVNDFMEVNHANATVIDLIKNDSYPVGSNLSVSIILPATQGQASIQNTTELVYQSNASCMVTDSLAYVISDGLHNDTAWVYFIGPQILFNGIKTGNCNPNSYLVSPVLSMGGESSWLWSDGDTSRVKSTAGLLTYQLTITDSLGCTFSDSVSFNNRTAAPPYAFNSVQCSAGIPSCFVYADGIPRWFDAATGGNLLQSGGNTYQTAISQTTTFYVGIDYGTCNSGRSAVTAEVSTPVNSIFPIGDTLVCPGGYVRLDSNTDPDVLFQWYKDSTAIPGADSYFYFARFSGNYRLEATRRSDSCSSQSNVIQVYRLDAAPQSLNGQYSFCLGDSLMLTVPYSPALNYQWTFNGQVIPNETQNTLFAKDSGLYALQIDYPGNCQITTLSRQVIINCMVGIASAASDHLPWTIQQNPVSDILLLRAEANHQQLQKIELFDCFGQLIQTIIPESHAANQIIAVEALSSGLYFLKLTAGSQSQTLRFTKLH